MFYYPTVLRHGSGCFSTIWLVATKGAKVPRRDFLKVNVIRTCDDVMNYVLEQVPPPQPGLPRPRFSLYLSSQLQYGIILVYHRQCVILLEELHQTVKQLLKHRIGQKIDLDDQTKHSQVLPDALSLMEETEQGLDPSFGVISGDHELPSPSTLMRMGDGFMTPFSPELSSELTSPASTGSAAAAATAAAAAGTGLTASQESITLREQEPVTVPTAEFEGAELSDQLFDIIDLLSSQADHFQGEVRSEATAAGDRPLEMERGQDVERERTPELTASTTEMLPHTVSSADVILPQEEPSVAEETPIPAPAHLTPVSLPVLPSPPAPPPPAAPQRSSSVELEELPTTEKKRKRRQLIFFDPETQIPGAELEKQINQPMTQTRPLTMAVPPALPTAAELFNRPCTSLPKDVLYLWKRAATVKSIPSSDLQPPQIGPESTESEEKEMEVSKEVERVEQRRRLSSREDFKDGTDSDLFSGLLLDGTDPKELSGEISPLITSDREGSVVSRFVSALGDIPEVVGESVIGELFPPEASSAPVLFHSLLPPEADRRTVSTIFQRLLEILSSRKVCAEQNQPFGDIKILPGP